LRRSRPFTDLYRTAEGIHSIPLGILRNKIFVLIDELQLLDLAKMCKRWYLAINGRYVRSGSDALLIEKLHQMLNKVVRERHRTDEPELKPLTESNPLRYDGVYGRCYVFAHQSQECELNYEALKRKHLKNSIYWVCFPDFGIYYQKCHDIECKERLLKMVQPALPHVKVSVEKGEGGDEKDCCLVSNSLLQVQGMIAHCGRGVVREIDEEVLFHRVLKNVRPPSAQLVKIIFSVHSHSKTILQVGDLVTVWEEEAVLWELVKMEEAEEQVQLRRWEEHARSETMRSVSYLKLNLTGAVLHPVVEDPVVEGREASHSLSAIYTEQEESSSIF
jgi:hypothetical protein